MSIIDNLKKKSPADRHAAAVAKVAEWLEALASLETKLTAAEGRQPETPADVETLALEWAKLTASLRMTRAALAAAEADVVAAAKAVVEAEADAMVPRIAKLRKELAVWTAKTEDLRAQLLEHTGMPWVMDDPLRQPGYKSAAHGPRSRSLTRGEVLVAEIARLEKLQRGYRAAAAGEGVRGVWPAVADLPALLHPETGILPQTGYLVDIERDAYEQDRARRVAEAQDDLDAIAKAARFKGGLRAAEYPDADPGTLLGLVGAETVAEGVAVVGDPQHVEWLRAAGAVADTESFIAFRDHLAERRKADGLRQRHDPLDVVEV